MAISVEHYKFLPQLQDLDLNNNGQLKWTHALKGKGLIVNW